ncbi:hypothetical protein O6H91_20G005500 [Diphasiastrum complanatum]|nr:hypothetical protein O6H91_20G005500 [Diphasiastrum complanatum]
MSKTAEKLNDATGASDLSISRKSATATGVVPQAKKTNDVQELEFEAKSARDSAWYDVSMFLDHRISDAGEPEVKVRYTGFGPEEDEWVHIKTAVRQRSLPCEVLECVAVLPGDLILCFQEGSEQALYYDAHILDVQRRRHDVRGCRCRFWVRYLHDQSEEVVPLRKVCRRPETEYRLKQAQRSSKAPTASEALQWSQVGMVSPSPGTSRAEVHPLSKVSSGTQVIPTDVAQVQNSTSQANDSIMQAVTHIPGAPSPASVEGMPSMPNSIVAEAAAKVSQDLAVHDKNSSPPAVDGTYIPGSVQSLITLQISQQQTPS